VFFWICNFEEKQILENVDDIDMRKKKREDDEKQKN